MGQFILIWYESDDSSENQRGVGHVANPSLVFASFTHFFFSSTNVSSKT